MYERDVGECQIECGKRLVQLANEGFTSKAAPDVVEQEREKRDRLTVQLAAIDAQLAQLAEGA